MNSLLQLIKYRPRLLWSGVGISLVGLAALAGFSLTHIGTVAIPIFPWLLGAVVLSIAAVAVTIGVRVQQQAQTHRHPRRATSTLKSPPLLHTSSVPEENQLPACVTESLAEKMDIRKQRSLNSILQQP